MKSTIFRKKRWDTFLTDLVFVNISECPCNFWNFQFLPYSTSYVRLLFSYKNTKWIQAKPSDTHNVLSSCPICTFQLKQVLFLLLLRNNNTDIRQTNESLIANNKNTSSIERRKRDFASIQKTLFSFLIFFIFL